MDYIVNGDDYEIVIEQRTSEQLSRIVSQLVDIRKQSQMTQQDIADRTGIKRANISRIESQKYTTRLDILMKYADALGMQIQMDLRGCEKNTLFEKCNSKLPIDIN